MGKFKPVIFGQIHAAGDNHHEDGRGPAAFVRRLPKHFRFLLVML
jgi:hypothetical protein